MSPGRAVTCKHVQDLLDDYRRGKLLPGQRQMITDHLNECGDCKAELELRENLARQMVAALPESKAPAGLSPAIMAAITAASRADSSSRPHRKNSSLLPLMLTAAAAIIMSVALYQVGAPKASDTAVIAAKADAPVVGAFAAKDRELDKAVPATPVLAEDMSLSAQQPSADAVSAQATGVASEHQEIAKEAASAEMYSRYPAAPPQPAATQPARESDSPLPAGMASVLEEKTETRASAAEAAPLADNGATVADRRLSQAEQPQQAARAVYSTEDRWAAAPPPAENANRFFDEAAPASRAQQRVRFMAGSTASTATAETTSTAVTTGTATLTTATAVATTGTTSVQQGEPR